MSLKKLIVALSLLTTTTLSAYAADLAPQPVEPVAPIEAAPFTWTGFYVGAHAGYGVGSSSLNLGGNVIGFAQQVAPFLGNKIGDWSSNGALGGAQIGYNYQFNAFVIGAEIDGDFSGIQGNLNELNLIQFKTKTEWLGSARLRVGYAFDRALFYATGGLAGGEVKNSVQAIVIGGPSHSETDWGWTAGVGMEYAITDHWSARLDYRHVDLGDNSQTFAFPIGNTAATVKFKYKNAFDLGTVGVNYRF